jgi:hypothetical protein
VPCNGQPEQLSNVLLLLLPSIQRHGIRGRRTEDRTNPQGVGEEGDNSPPPTTGVRATSAAATEVRVRRANSTTATGGQRLQVKAELLDLRVGGHPPLSAAARTALLASPLPVRAHLEAQRPRPVRDHLDSLIVLTTRGTDVPLGLMMNPVMSYLNLLVKVEAGDQLPLFCLLTQDLPPMAWQEPG